MPDNSLSPPDPDGAPRLLAARAHLVDALAHLELTYGVVMYLDPVPAYAGLVADSVASVKTGVARLDQAIIGARATTTLQTPSDSGCPLSPA